MTSKKIVVIVLVALVLVLGAGTVTVFLLNQSKENTKQTEQGEVVLTEADLETFAAWTDCKIYQDIPVMTGKNIKIGEADDYGNKNYVIDVNGTTIQDYKEYVAKLQKVGFEKHSDNGEDGMEGYVYTTSLKKDELTLVVSHVDTLNKTYLSATNGLALSPYLNYDSSWNKGVSADAQTKVHMLELNNNGNSFVIQLKNGHYVLHDGGLACDAPYLLDYLEELTPGTDKPVIDAWFISHAHADHTGAFVSIVKNPEYAERILVNGIYFTEPTEEFIDDSGYSDKLIWFVTKGYTAFKTEDGEVSKLYRPQLGQRYYFCDMTIDVALTSEQIPYDNYFEKDFNDSSIWLMHHIEGQKFLVAGDSHHTGMRLAMSMFDESYFNVEVFAVLHHGINVYKYFTDYITFKTALYTNWRVGSLWVEGTEGGTRRPDLVRAEDNAYFQSVATECISHGDGTVVLSFPYQVGDAEIMEPCDWRYNNGKPDREPRK